MSDSLKKSIANQWYERGLRHYQDGNNAGALAAFERVLEIDPDLVAAWHNKGVALNDLGKPDEALDAYERALEIDPDLAYAWNNKGNALNYLGKPDEALDAYERALEINPNFAGAWNGKGSALVDLDKPGEALEAYERALEINPNFAYAWNGKGNALVDLDKPGEALEAYERALEINPNFAGAWNGKGSALVDLDKPGEALEAYERALEINPNFAYAWNGKGNALVDLDKPDEALEAYERALEINPNSAAAWNGKGNALVDLDKPDEALSAYKRSISLDPTWHDVWFNFGSLYWKDLDAPGQAQAAFIRSLHLARQGKMKANALQALQSMDTTPLVVVRTYQKHHALKQLLREPKAYADASRQCSGFFQRLDLFAREPDLPASFQSSLLGLEALALGDPVWAAQFFAQRTEAEPRNLFAQYYLALSRLSYHETSAAVQGLQDARGYAEDTLDAFLQDRDAVHAEELYYAGLILAMEVDTTLAPDADPYEADLGKARRCLVAAVAGGWHPARYVLAGVLDACGDVAARDAAIQDLIDAERALHSEGQLGFLYGVPHSRLSLDAFLVAAAVEHKTLDLAGFPRIGGHEPWSLPVRAQAAYAEIAGALPLVYGEVTSKEENGALPDDYAFIDRYPEIDPTAYQEAWKALEQQTAWVEKERKKTTAHEVDALRDDLDATLRRRYWRQQLAPEGLPSPDDADGRAELEEELSFEIEDDRAGARAETHLKLIRYLVLRDALPARSAVLLSAYLGSCLSDDQRRDIASKCMAGAIGYPLGQVAGSMVNTFTVLTITAAGGLVSVALGLTSSILTTFLAERVFQSTDVSKRCSYRDFKTHFYDRLLDLRPAVQDRLKDQGLWDAGYDDDMDRMGW